MSDQPTPETDTELDRLQKSSTSKWGEYVYVELARRLERERDEWRKNAVELCAQRDKLAETLQSLQVACFRIGRGDVNDVGVAVAKMRQKALDTLEAMEGGKP